jgi:hypothetical protein
MAGFLDEYTTFIGADKIVKSQYGILLKATGEELVPVKNAEQFFGVDTVYVVSKPNQPIVEMPEPEEVLPADWFDPTPASETALAATFSDFILTIATDADTAHALRVKTNIPNPAVADFTVFANEVDPYDGWGSSFTAAGVSVTYNAINTEWQIDFGDAITASLFELGTLSIVAEIKDQYGRLLTDSIADPATEQQFSYTFAPVESLAASSWFALDPASETVVANAAVPFELTIGTGFETARTLEIKTDLPSPDALMDFTLVADETDPYGGNESTFTDLGVSVTYSATTKEWVIDFGQDVTDSMFVRSNVQFVAALKDGVGRQLTGSIDDPQAEQQFWYTFDAT